jgi:hypothetical protein
MRSESLKRAQKNYRKSQKGKKARQVSMKFQHLKVRMQIIELLGNKCANPYNLDHGDFNNKPECLQIDHIHGGGRKEVKKFTNYQQYLKYVLEQVKDGSKEYQLLCANCNWMKRDTNEE